MKKTYSQKKVIVLSYTSIFTLAYGITGLYPVKIVAMELSPPEAASIQQAVAQEDLPLLKQLLDNGADPNTPSSKYHLASILHEAVYADNYAMVETLLEYGANPNGISYFTSSPLTFATQLKRAAIVYVLLTYGAQRLPQETPIEFFLTPLENSAINEFPDLFSQRLQGEEGSDMSIKELMQLLKLAAGQGFYEIVNRLLSYIDDRVAIDPSPDTFTYITQEITKAMRIIEIILTSRRHLTIARVQNYENITANLALAQSHFNQQQLLRLLQEPPTALQQEEIPPSATVVPRTNHESTTNNTRHTI